MEETVTSRYRKQDESVEKHNDDQTWALTSENVGCTKWEGGLSLMNRRTEMGRFHGRPCKERSCKEGGQHAWA